jgi:hypothetical protein
MRPRDTTPDAHAVQLDIYRNMEPARCIRLVFEMSERARELAIAGEMAREPGMTREEARSKVLRMILGNDLFEAAYGKRRRA